MNKSDFPTLYIAADSSSNDAQKSLLNYNRWTTLLLIFAVLTSFEGWKCSYLPSISAIFFIGSLGTYTFCKFQKFTELWYKSRALAESIKTATWRLLMSSEPFNNKDKEINLELFRKLITELLNENKGLAKHLSNIDPYHEVITERMLNIMDGSFDEKKEIYLNSRIENQKIWYSTKSGENRQSSDFFFWLIVITYGIAIVLLLIRVKNPELPFLPIDVCAIVASGLIGWTEIKQYDELASAYGHTSHEIGIIKSRFKSVTNKEHLALFVKDAESAFSREHTQWAARRDH